MLKIKNKKAQIGATLVWMIATLIIIFMMIIFIVAVLFITGKEKLPFTKKRIPEITKEKIQPESDLITGINLNTFLKTPVSGTKIQELILLSLDPYIENKIDLDKLDNIRWRLGEEILAATKKKDEEVFKNSQNILDKFCSDYMLKIPQGVIKKGKEDFVSEGEFETGNWKEILLVEWTPWVELKILYGNQLIKIKYRQLKKC